MRQRDRVERAGIPPGRRPPDPPSLLAEHDPYPEGLTMTFVYWLCFALLCVYVWIMVAAYRAARARRTSDLVCRIAPYRGGWFPRTPAEQTAEVIPFPGYSVKVPDEVAS